MSRTFADLQPEEQEALDKTIRNAAQRQQEEKAERTATKEDLYGICAGCNHFCCVESEFEVRAAWCSSEWLRRNLQPFYLTSVHPIRKCSEFSRKGHMNLWEMKQIAILIDIPKRKAGFTEEK